MVDGLFDPAEWKKLGEQQEAINLAEQQRAIAEAKEKRAILLEQEHDCPAREGKATKCLSVRGEVLEFNMPQGIYLVIFPACYRVAFSSKGRDAIDAVEEATGERIICRDDAERLVRENRGDGERIESVPVCWRNGNFNPGKAIWHVERLVREIAPARPCAWCGKETRLGKEDVEFWHVPPKDGRKGSGYGFAREKCVLCDWECWNEWHKDRWRRYKKAEKKWLREKEKLEEGRRILKEIRLCQRTQNLDRLRSLQEELRRGATSRT